MKLSFLTLYLVDVIPPERQGAQPVFSIFPQPPQKPAGTLPELAPTFELLSFCQTLCADKEKQPLVAMKK